MVTAGSVSDVFLSYSASDRRVAEDIADRLRAAGLEPFRPGDVAPGEDVSDAIWNALAECRGLIVIVSEDAAPDAMTLVEIGAASAWNKPVYVVLSGPSSTRLPEALRSWPAYPRSRIDEVVQRIRDEFEPLSEDDRELLADTYRELRVPADQLGQSASALRDLTRRFNRRARKQLSGERLLSELLRLRKKGALPRVGR